MTANLDCLVSVCEEVRNPVGECGTQALNVKFHKPYYKYDLNKP